MKYNSKVYAKEAHKPAKRGAKLYDNAIFAFPMAAIYGSQILITGDKGMGLLNGLVDNGVLRKCFKRELISIEPTLKIRAEPDYLLMIEQIRDGIEYPGLVKKK